MIKFHHLLSKIRIGIFLLITKGLAVSASTALWTFESFTPTTFAIPSNINVVVKYQITNQSSHSHTLVVNPIPGVTQITTGFGICSNPFMLLTKGSSCILSLKITGSQLTNNPIINGPIVCQQGSFNQCYRPSQADILQVTQTSPVTNCVNTGNNNIACQIIIANQTNYGFTNMSYALCRSAQCDYNGSQTQVSCNCQLIAAGQGINSASISPLDYDTSKPIGNNVTSTYSMVNSSGETPTHCSTGPFANCFGAPCVVNGGVTTCTCPVAIGTFIAPQTNCIPGPNKIWSATSTTSFFSIEASMLYMYATFFSGRLP